MGKSSTTKDAQALFQSLRSAYVATPTNLKIIDLYVMFAVFTALIQVVYMAIVGSFPFNSFLSGVLSCAGTAVLAGKHCYICVGMFPVIFRERDVDFSFGRSLSPYPSEQRKQGIQGFAARACFCGLCSLQFGAAFGDYELHRIKRHLRTWNIFHVIVLVIARPFL
ncbi:hypothetical protein RHMOL_Rhmol11G0068900 [Rhododendron molle]|uniref:Uncharacterized protein n=1 Tax=Rhododendron molle TaxID=49168 RepID=A0ACC0LQJ4_RHOML|nr:hypothetical protein RHMOL_Rhmol11G0068900 [Rhododendron molle]